MKRKISFLPLGFLLSFNFITTAQAAVYSITDLGAANLAASSIPMAINNIGEVVGNFDVPNTSNGRHAFLYDTAGMHDLTQQSGGHLKSAFGINNNGVVVGQGVMSLSSAIQHASLYSIAGGFQYLGTLNGISGTSIARAINDNGQIVGKSISSTYTDHAFIYQTNQMTDLGTLYPNPINLSVATDINSYGLVVGSSTVGAGLSRAFLYETGVMKDLGTLGGMTASANAINDSGQIVGGSTTINGYGHAFLYSVGSMLDLGTLVGDLYSGATSINSKGQIVGFSQSSFATDHAGFLYEAGNMQNLNDLIDSNTGWSLTRATDINDNGQIIGVGMLNGYQRGFLLTPVPVPAVGWLLSIVLAYMSFMGRQLRNIRKID